MSRLTEFARNASCTVRLPCCNFTPETTVAAHYRSLRLGAGGSLKPHDIFTAHACSACHDVIDGRRELDGYTREQIRLAHAEAVMETIYLRIRLGKVKL
jgi:hypothetical protein